MLKRHLKTVHNITKELRCNFCERSFEQAVSLKRHIKKIHKEINEKQCPFCKKVFGQVGCLKRHIKSIHEKIKNHKCTFCERAFVQASHLKRHIETFHEKIKPFQCSFCERAFYTVQNLRGHIKTVHEKIKEHQCNFCKRAFGYAGTLRTHIKTVHKKIKEHKCNFCGHKFGQKNNLKLHIERAHEIDLKSEPFFEASQLVNDNKIQNQPQNEIVKEEFDEQFLSIKIGSTLSNKECSVQLNPLNVQNETYNIIQVNLPSEFLPLGLRNFDILDVQGSVDTVICPGCNKGEGDRPMICCDSCDVWYHFHCVKIEKYKKRQNWFCPSCAPTNAHMKTDVL